MAPVKMARVTVQDATNLMSNSSVPQEMSDGDESIGPEPTPSTKEPNSSGGRVIQVCNIYQMSNGNVITFTKSHKEDRASGTTMIRG